MRNTYEQAVEKIVNFWVDKSFNVAMNQDNGDNSPDSGLGSILMNMISLEAQQTATKEKIVVFKNELKSYLLSVENGSIYQKTLDVDYTPNEPLFNAIEKAGINSRCLPIKTTTWINDENIAISKYQYGGKLVEL